VVDQQTGLGIATQGLTLTATFGQFATQALQAFRAAARLMRTRAQAVSSTSTALSGSWRPAR
jgi:hypothetical protein